MMNSVIGNGNEVRTLIVSFLEKVFDFIVQHKYESTSSTTEDVGEGSLEEGTSTFTFRDSCPAVSSALVENVTLGSARLHHHTPTHSVEGIRDNTSYGGNALEMKRKQFLVSSLSLIK